MTLMIKLNAEAESRLKTAATRAGVEPEIYAQQIIEENLPATEDSPIDRATLDLLARWDAEDETTDPKEIAARQEELGEFKRSIIANRTESEGPDSRKIFP